MIDNNVPQHVAIIMDGNGRWAEARGLPRIEGHRQGIKRVREILAAAGGLGIKFLTLFAFSSENWKRPKNEIDTLMRFLDNFLSRNLKELQDNNIRLSVIGRKDPIPKHLWDRLINAQAKTKDNTGLVVNLAFNYGSRQEIVDAVKKVLRETSRQGADIEKLDEEGFGKYLYTAGIPDPDLLIRTSGSMRLSNFLLWQLSYTELYFPKVYWPDFRKKDLEEAIAEYKKRIRRFGGVNN